MENIENKKILLWLDDMRDPFTGTWVKDYSPIGIDNINVIWVKNYAEFTLYINDNGLPDAICFDHDLADMEDDWQNEKTGYDCAKYIVDYCIDHNIDIPAFGIQSSNPAGKNNIEGLLNNYHNFYLKSNDR